jgi:hypothetical protein
MWVADMNFATSPSITDAITRRVQHPAFGYFSPRDEYYNAIIDWHKERNGVTGLEKEHIGYANGVLGGVISAMNVLCFKAVSAVSSGLPADDGIEVFLPGSKISESRVFCTFDDGFGDCGSGGKVHVSHPHGYDIKAFAELSLWGDTVRVCPGIHCNGIHSSSVEYAFKIVFHICLRFSF